MNEDPYRVLGVSSSATDDEVKAAYRKLAKQYHPDVNGGSQASETMMKRINEAYAEIMKMRRGGGSARSSGGAQQTGPSGGPGYGYGYGSPFGWGGFGGAQSGGAGYGSGRTSEEETVRSYILFGRYQEALNLLNRMGRHDAEWHFLSAKAHLGLGNSVAAMQYAQQATEMDPENWEYRQFLDELEGGSREYRSYSSGFGGMPRAVCQNPCLMLCIANVICNLLGGCCPGGGYYGRFW